MDKSEQLSQSIELLKQLRAQAVALQETAEMLKLSDERVDERIKLNQQLIEAIDHVLAEGNWSDGVLLKTIGDRLQSLKKRFQQTLELGNAALQPGPDNLAQRVAKRTGQREVFVSLYNADGNSLQKWERLLQTIGSQLVSRPVYQKESHVRALVRSKLQRQNEAYINAYVSEHDFLVPPGGQHPTDKLGHPLLLVKQGAFAASDIIRFVHRSGQYVYKLGRLVREGDDEFSDFI